MDIPDLKSALRGLRWALTGAAAARLYMPERATVDVDIVVNGSDAAAAREALRAAGYDYRSELGIGGSSWSSPGGVPIDVIELSYPWTDTALEAASRNLDPRDLPVLPLAYLVLMKLEAGRVQDIADITRMLGQADDDAIKAVRRAIADYAPDDADDVESLIALGRMEFDGND